MTLQAEDFVTRDGEETFQLLESEYGDLWFYGHDTEKFAKEATKFFRFYNEDPELEEVPVDGIELTWGVVEHLSDGQPGRREFSFTTVPFYSPLTEGIFPVSVIRS